MEQGWRSGPRLRDRPLSSRECWRCAEPGRGAVNAGRVLRAYALVTGGKVIGTVELCGPCAATVAPLNPDPLTVEAA